MQAPASVSMQDASLPVSVTVTAEDTQVQINKVTVEIIAQSQSLNFQQPTKSGIDPVNATTFQTVARAENTQVFSLAPQQSQTLQLSIVMNAGAAVESQLPEGSAGQAVAHGLKELQSLSEVFNSNSYTYTLKASADVEGVALDPSKSQPLQILKPGQIGGAFNLKL